MCKSYRRGTFQADQIRLSDFGTLLGGIFFGRNLLDDLLKPLAMRGGVQVVCVQFEVTTFLVVKPIDFGLQPVDFGLGLMVADGDVDVGFGRVDLAVADLAFLQQVVFPGFRAIGPGLELGDNLFPLSDGRFIRFLETASTASASFSNSLSFESLAAVLAAASAALRGSIVSAWRSFNFSTSPCR